jgi:hypothetical protein
MQRMRTVTSTLVLATTVLTPNPGPASAGGAPADGAGRPGAAVMTAQRDGTSKETPSAAPAGAPVPSYIEADRAGVERALGAALTDQVFSDRFTPLRKQLIAASLRANPAPGCARPPDFVLEVVAPIEASADASAWQERYLIKCNPDVRRTFLLVSTKTGMKSAELAPGGRCGPSDRPGRRSRDHAARWGARAPRGIPGQRAEYRRRPGTVGPLRT